MGDDLDALINDLNEFAKKPDPELDDILAKLDQATIEVKPIQSNPPPTKTNNTVSQPPKPVQTQNAAPKPANSTSTTPLIKSNKVEENLFPWQQEELQKREEKRRKEEPWWYEDKGRMKEQNSNAKENFNRLIDKKATSLKEEDKNEGKSLTTSTSSNGNESSIQQLLKKHEDAQKKTQEVLTKSTSTKVATKNVTKEPAVTTQPSFPQLNINIPEEDFSQLDEISASLTQIIDDKPISRFNSGFTNSQTPVPKNPNAKVAQEISNITLDIQFSIPPDQFKKETFIQVIHNCRAIITFFQVDSLAQFQPAEFILSVKTLIENVEKLEDDQILLSLADLTPETIKFVKEVVGRGNSMTLDEFDRGAAVVQKILTDSMQIMKQAAPRYQQ